jgi:NTE family protein
MVGAMKALQDEIGLDLRDVQEYVGTSAGSILVTLLGAGVSVDDLLRHQLGKSLTSGPMEGYEFSYEEAAGGDHPMRPRRGLGSRSLLRNNARNLRRLPPTTVLSALVPEGRGSLDSIGAMVAHVVPTGWVDRDGVTVVALDYDTGQRIPFGRDEAPEVDQTKAVMASCSIPGWFHPVSIGDHRYIDGGTWSSTNVDLMAGLGLDHVYVLAPTVSFDLDSPRHLSTRLERHWRNRVTLRCLREVEKVQAEGSEVTVLGPGRADLEAMGANLMNASRRTEVIRTSLRTSAAALREARPLPESHHFEEDP